MEIWIDKTVASGVPYSEGERVAVQLVISGQTCQAGLRATRHTEYVWNCPDLLDANGDSVHLANVLGQHGFQKNKRVYLEVIGKSIHLIHA